MRKSLLPMFAALALCGASAAALAAANVHSETTLHKPVMTAAPLAAAQAAPLLLAQNDPRGMRRAPPPPSQDEGPSCNEIYSGRADDLRQLETRLSLTSAQTPLFARWRQITLDGARRAERECNAAQRNAGNMDLFRMLDEEERGLRQRLSDLQTERPALEAFYRSLNPGQRAEFDNGGQQDERDDRGRPPRR